jgi:8-oxo-dGTP pyrophosphatase MutT (NUDIX family)
MAISAYLASLRAHVGHAPLHVPSVGVIPRDEGGRILLVRDAATGLWQTVGGAMDPGESPEEAALREAREETGLQLELTRLVGAFGGPAFRLTYPNGDVCDYVSILYEARVVGGESRPDGEEVDGLQWFAPSELEALELQPHTRLLLDATLAVTGQGRAASSAAGSC